MNVKEVLTGQEGTGARVKENNAEAGWVPQVVGHLQRRASVLRAEWFSRRPFRYLLMDEFLPPHLAEMVHDCYPRPDESSWERVAYTHQRHKLMMRGGFPPPIRHFFAVTEAPAFRAFITDITGIQNLLHDPALIGGGLHQIQHGGFLDVHVDFNYHPDHRLHRRLNLLVYMNKDWRPEYEGYLELWDLKHRRQLEHIAPAFNRAVLFETNEVSFHGHPRPLAGPASLTRKSLAVYYYTTERAPDETSPEHNTMYHQTTGWRGYIKTLRAGVEASLQRLKDEGPRGLLDNLREHAVRLVLGRPPKNK